MNGSFLRCEGSHQRSGFDPVISTTRTKRVEPPDFTTWQSSGTPAEDSCESSDEVAKLRAWSSASALPVIHHHLPKREKPRVARRLSDGDPNLDSTRADQGARGSSTLI